MINWLFNEKFVLLGIFVSTCLVSFAVFDCAKKNKKGKNKKKAKETETDSEPSKKGKKKKPSKEESGEGEDDEENSGTQVTKTKSVITKKKGLKKKGKQMNSRMPKQNKGRFVSHLLISILHKISTSSLRLKIKDHDIRDSKLR
ncbi:hypothetical protein B9Z55_002419 [Caenorhabditis nigoni]|nr:hypothetical protein B9Z55_002419 [Caenorhabditis nigoni]